MIRKQSLGELIFLIIIIAYPINIELGFSIRIIDMMVLFALIIFFLNYKFKKSVITNLSFILFFIYLISTIYGMLNVGIKNYENFFFIYKYILPFLLILLLSNLKLKYSSINKLIKVAVFVYLFMIVWVYFFIGLSFVGVFPLGLRPAFPFTDVWSEKTTDAHLYSAYISNGLIFFIVLCKMNYLKISGFIKNIIVIMSLVSMLLTGSRNGLLSFGLSYMVIISYPLIDNLINNKFLFSRKGFLKSIIFGVLGTIAVFILLQNFLDSEDLGKFVSRALNFNFFNDTSSSQRVEQLATAFNLIVNESLMFGIGMQSYSGQWFDGGVAAVLVSMGLLGVVIYIAIIVTFLVRLNMKKVDSVLVFYIAIVFFNYIIANLVSEFFLITRSVVPFSINIALLLQLFDYKSRIKESL